MRAALGTPARDALRAAITALAAAGCETPRLDAEVMLCEVLDVGRERLILDDRLELAAPAARRFGEAVRRRAAEREPVAYITGKKGFRRLRLMVDRRALIPRPETELLVEFGLRLPAGSTVLDVCTGSGAVALALADERPDLHVWASDISESALDLARENAARLGLEVRFLHSDLLDGVPDQVDAVLANPPYVTEAELSALSPEIARHEPRTALFGGSDGLAVIAPLIEQAGRRPRIASIALEVGAGQAERAQALMRRAAFTDVSVQHDLAGIERVVSGRR